MSYMAQSARSTATGSLRESQHLHPSIHFHAGVETRDPPPSVVDIKKDPGTTAPTPLSEAASNAELPSSNFLTFRKDYRMWKKAPMLRISLLLNTFPPYPYNH